MRRFLNSNRFARVCLVVLVVLGTVVDVRTGEQQTPRWSGPIDTIRVAHEMLEAFFPELRGHKYPMLVMSNQFFDRPVLSEMVLRSFGIVVKESEDDISALASDAPGQHFLAGIWEFTPDGDLDHMFLQGRANHYREYRALLAEMIEHPTWSPTQARTAFAGRQVRYWPENQQQFLATVQPALAKLAALFGGEARNVQVEFRLAVETSGPANATTSSSARFDWHADVEIVSFFPGRPTKKLALTFEPIGGKLLRIIGVD
jgi:hypothetical protein